jgi:predicted dinucleotide-binding enzyme
MKKKIGIIGAGNLAKTLARKFLKAGYEVTLSNTRGAASLTDVIADLGKGAAAGTPEAAVKAEIVILAIPWDQIKTLTKLTDWKNKIVIDATNHFISYAPEFKTADLGGKASSEVVATFVPGARLVKAFNTLYFKILGADPSFGGGKRVLFLSGDDLEAKKVVSELIVSMGHAPIDIGSLAEGSKTHQANGPLAGTDLILLDTVLA